ncbi:hypothetical protein [Desulfosporosinus sp. FKA]|uniref:hypothetical protein n=1 Tax=Desulfosporosinus sp. FKA TaxID=1969834 RepID=UPI000B49AEF7|nr:hypothetical protein [Desulfosporosinus sp. FKA]
MSMNLVELGNVLCEEFDQRKHELETIQTEIWTKVKNDKDELAEQRKVDQRNQLVAIKQVLESAQELLENFEVEHSDMKKVLVSNFKSQVEERMVWAGEREEELKGWYKAGEYLFGTKIVEGKKERKFGEYATRKRIGR